MSNCYEQIFSYIMVRPSYIQWYDNVVCFVVDENALLDFYRTSSLKQESMGKHDAPLGNIIRIPSQPVFAPTS
jgi:hypothetical protein